MENIELKLPDLTLIEWADIDLKSFVRKWKHNVRKKVKYALATGKIQKDICEICGSKSTEAHHPNYFMPYLILWVCRKHHIALHDERYATNLLT